MKTAIKLQKIYQWLDERVDLKKFQDLAAHKTVPQHKHTIWYYLGGMTLFLFVVQVVTGILLLLYYRPSAEQAFESVQFIMTEVTFGWLVRSIHSWSANLMIFTLFLHMFSVFFMKAYRKPRELTWVSGVLLFFLALGFGFSGYLLPWNQLAYSATKVGTEIAGAVPLVGDFILKFLRGGTEVSGATLTRFYGFHVAVLPMIATAVLLLHLFLVQKQGMSRPLELKSANPAPADIPFFPNFFLRDVLGWTLALGVLVALASIFPWELGEKADPLAPAPAGIKPEWYFLFMFQTLKFLPAKILFFEGEILGILFFTVLFGILIFVPFLDKKANLGISSRPLLVVGWCIVAFIILMTLWGVLL
ncbi:MAG TPA: cytochrome b N-terminal domain-containing protein [candidate division Zixibacteria bacterium]|nr:cytochrome b N-terminal domain-containing protein [candidate division Zixibacteria bacterium]